MQTAWYIVQYVRKPSSGFPMRAPAIFDQIDQIRADGGECSVVEILGNLGLAKVRANVAVHTALGILYERLPDKRMDEPLSDMSESRKTNIRNRLIEMGYSVEEIRSSLGNDFGSKTFGDLLRFMATRRRKPRFDKNSDQIILDGDVVSCESVDRMDTEVV